ncbi:MAG: tRNA (5-methylaminomethyl-2-thiouridine)(34)-methyltransferase MnmD [Bacteroidota bacterium]|nr:tRNA (5-methylaminomethyl-2-thiouridine)(34)-methyltransferase MnmD [Bacteroidota bacterium]
MKERKIIVTSDGSHTLFIPGLNEQYHSVHGAVQESQHVYIDAGLKNCEKDEISVFEMGFGTGLNALMTFQYALRKRKKINYYCIEKYPLSEEEYILLNYANQLKINERGIFKKMHELKNGESLQITDYFRLTKFISDIKDFKFSFNFDVCFFDAFAPDIQPGLWTSKIFSKLFEAMNEGGILTTYSAKGIVKRNLQHAGFKVEKLPGPPGKREIIRAGLQSSVFSKLSTVGSR